MSSRTFTLASRASQLAQAQTNMTLAALEALHPHSSDASPKFTKEWLSSAGDRDQTQALYTLNSAEGKSFWTKDLEVALLDKKVDILVHAFKDVPTTLPDGCVIAGVLEREDPVDSLITRPGSEWKTLEDLPDGSVVGTSSVRRIAQLKRNYPNLQFKDCRGNIDTRLAKLDAPDSPYAAIILARAGVVRLGLGARLTSDLPPPILFHAVSQGAIGFEVRADDTEALALCQQITHRPTFLRCMAERAFLHVLEGGCSVPVGVATALDEQDYFEMTGCITALDGSEHIQRTLKEKIGTREDAEAIGARLARILIEAGAEKILQAVKDDREERNRLN
ncbi:Porphobilinogen deaminase [Mycena indigotica]|uniref:hydroxymethylbilane synthase n=1 Tax=Mycena indigotica TaxID=2126181 RepID=A0A8H6W0A1_9AGAR|nr:Porphobilinogen deaminase [Mycena indigotica]KAF7294684.1 Porphobilinogen deaminase [Mycena indigotica]